MGVLGPEGALLGAESPSVPIPITEYVNAAPNVKSPTVPDSARLVSVISMSHDTGSGSAVCHTLNLSWFVAALHLALRLCRVPDGMVFETVERPDVSLPATNLLMRI